MIHSMRLERGDQERQKMVIWNLLKLTQQYQGPNSPVNLDDQMVAVMLKFFKCTTAT